MAAAAVPSVGLSPAFQKVESCLQTLEQVFQQKDPQWHQKIDVETTLSYDPTTVQWLNQSFPHPNGEKRKQIEQYQVGPSLYSPSMTPNELQLKTQDFFLRMKTEGRLTNRAAFDEEYEKVFATYPLSGLIDIETPKRRSRKTGDIVWEKGFVNSGAVGRVLGAEYVDRLVRQLGLKHVGAPTKYLVIEQDENKNPLQQLRVTIDGQNTISTRNLSGGDFDPVTETLKNPKTGFLVTQTGVTVYADNICRAEWETCQPDELDELLLLLFASEYSDFNEENFILGTNSKKERKIFMIDTEYKDFKVFPHQNINKPYGLPEKMLSSFTTTVQLINKLNKERFNRFESINDEKVFASSLFLELREIETQKRRSRKTGDSVREKGVVKNFGEVGRVLGAEYVDSWVCQLDAGAPRKSEIEQVQQLRVTIEGQNKMFTLDLSRGDLDPVTETLKDPKTGFLVTQTGVTVYAEHICRAERDTCHPDELDELLLFASGYSDFLGENVIYVTNSKKERTIFMIDTEYKDFKVFPHQNINKPYGLPEKMLSSFTTTVQLINKLNNEERFNCFESIHTATKDDKKQVSFNLALPV